MSCKSLENQVCHRTHRDRGGDAKTNSLSAISAFQMLNPANARMTISEASGRLRNRRDREAFEQALAEAVERTGTRLLAYKLVPNHWHLEP